MTEQQQEERPPIAPDEDYTITLGELRKDGLELEPLVQEGGGEGGGGASDGGGEGGGEGSGQQQYRLVVEPFDVLGCAAVSGFWADSSYLRPTGIGGLAGLAALAQEHGGAGKALLFGHADAAEGDGDALSERRAKAVLAVLEQDVDAWVALNDEEGWGLDVVQELCNALGHPAGPVDGQDGPKTQEGVKSFQESQSGAAGPVDGIAGPKTRKALFTAYFDRNRVELDAAALMDPKALGVGAAHLLQEADGPYEANRRVVCYFFKEPRLPTPPGQGEVAAFYERIQPYCGCEGGELLAPPSAEASRRGAEDGAPTAS